MSSEVSAFSQLDAFLDAARKLIASRLGKATRFALLEVPAVEQLLPGKMLRTHLAGRLGVRLGILADPDAEQLLLYACAAIELVHTASLCHDDVVDNAVIRRARPTLWQMTGPSAAVLIGDLLLCEGMRLMMEVADGRHLPSFMDKVREVVETEARQELCLRGHPVAENDCIDVARGKTGPLFAFVAEVCGGRDEALTAALREAGYRVGTAYQLADDLLDVVGDEAAAGKTLGTDRHRDKYTLVRVAGDGGRQTRRRVDRLCESAISCLDGHPAAQTALSEFFECDLQPVLERHVDACMELAE